MLTEATRDRMLPRLRLLYGDRAEETFEQIDAMAARFGRTTVCS